MQHRAEPPGLEKLAERDVGWIGMCHLSTRQRPIAKWQNRELELVERGEISCGAKTIIRKEIGLSVSEESSTVPAITVHWRAVAGH